MGVHAVRGADVLVLCLLSSAPPPPCLLHTQGLLQAHTDVVYLYLWLLAGAPLLTPSPTPKPGSAPAPASTATSSAAAVQAALQPPVAPIPNRLGVPSTILAVLDCVKELQQPSPSPAVAPGGGGVWQALVPPDLRLALVCQCAEPFRRAHSRLQRAFDVMGAEFLKQSAAATSGRRASKTVVPMVPGAWGHCEGVRRDRPDRGCA